MVLDLLNEGKDSGLRVKGLGFMVQGLWLRVYGFRPAERGKGLRVH